MSRPGGGGGGAPPPPSAGIGTGSAGTCFSGGAGSGGTYLAQITTGTLDAGIRGGYGSSGAFGGPSPAGTYMSGAGNPSDVSGAQVDANGTGGVLIIFVEGNINTPVGTSSTKFFTANGVNGFQALGPGSFSSPQPIHPFGGGSGGGIVILVNKNAANFTNNVEAKGGVVQTFGPSPNFQSGGNGAAVCYTFEQL